MDFKEKLPEDLRNIKVVSVLLFSAALFILRKWKVNPIYVLAGSGIAGILLCSLS